MRLGRPQIFTLTLSDTERAALTAMAASRTLPYSHVRRAQIILASADGESNTAIAQRFDGAVQTVGYWRRRFYAHRLAGLSDAPRSGRPRTHDDDRVADLLRTVPTSKPREGTHWSVRRAEAAGQMTDRRRLLPRRGGGARDPRPQTRSAIGSPIGMCGGSECRGAVAHLCLQGIRGGSLSNIRKVLDGIQ